jgi:peroxiredoxin
MRLLALFTAMVAAQAPALATSAAVAVVGAAAPDFALPSAQGGNLRLSEYRGQVVVIAFWSSRCSSCAAQLADLSTMQKTYGAAGLVTLAVSVDSDLARARAFADDLAQSKRSTLPMLLDADRVVGRSYGVDRLPTTVLIDRAGRVRHLFRDYRRTDNSYISQVRALLDDSGSAHLIVHDAGLHS